jgi:lysyl-tRNA synthetase class 2
MTFPSRRDTISWMGIRRRPPPPRQARRADWLAPLAGLLTVIVGAVNVASTLTPDLGSRARLLRQALPEDVPLLAHAFALPAGVALVIVGFYLARRRRRAWILALAILIAAGGLNLLKGLDAEEAAASWLLAGLLAWGRRAFWVLHDDTDWPTALRRIALVGAVSFSAVAVAVLAAAHWGSPQLSVARAMTEIGSLLSFGSGSPQYSESIEWLPAGVRLIELGVLVAFAYLVFRPLGGPRGPARSASRLRARRIVEVHGSDTLSFFKLRSDQRYLFDPDGRAFVAYQIEGGVLLVAGDPVGPADALPALVSELFAFAEARALKVGVVGASEEFAELARGTGLRSFYIGDEAIVDVRRFSLEGRSIRKVRQSVSRLERAGYVAEQVTVGTLDDVTLTELEAVSERWRAGSPERGFSMAMDSLRGEHVCDSTVVLARDSAGAVRGFLHFVPTYGRAAMSLSSMRRDCDTPNGLMEFLVVRAIQLLGERGVRELSLNFAAFARLLRSPCDRRERILARLVAIADGHFQVESLYRFNAKFVPRWEPRYLLYEGRFGLPRAGVAAMWAEGQLPRPRVRSGQLSQTF